MIHLYDMISLRISEELERRLDQAARAESKSRSEVIKDSIYYYLDRLENRPTAYQLGEKYFGLFASGRGDLSVNHRSIIAERIRKKHS